MKFPFFFKSSETTAAASWPWPACANDSRTLSFRSAARGALHATAGSAYDSDIHRSDAVKFPDEYQEEISSPESEIPLRGLRSARFFFEPGNSNSILEGAKLTSPPQKSAAILAEMDSNDPIGDFRVSMEEMVEAHGLRDWENLEKLLASYLMVNGESSHGYIIEAFVDLVSRLDLGSVFSDECSSAVDGDCSSSLTTAGTQCSFTCPLSFSSPTCSPASACDLSNVNFQEIEDGENGGC